MSTPLLLLHHHPPFRISFPPRNTKQVGVKAADVGSLIRQAPWLVLENIDGQMLPAVKFLTRVGVTDLERVVRAYPKILCASIRGELAPRVSYCEGGGCGGDETSSQFH